MDRWFDLKFRQAQSPKGALAAVREMIVYVMKVNGTIRSVKGNKLCQ
jgi:hypothetical protein